MRLNRRQQTALANLGEDLARGQKIAARIEHLLSAQEACRVSQEANYTVIATGKLPRDFLTDINAINDDELEGGHDG